MWWWWYDILYSFGHCIILLNACIIVMLTLIPLRYIGWMIWDICLLKFLPDDQSVKTVVVLVKGAQWGNPVSEICFLLSNTVFDGGFILDVSLIYDGRWSCYGDKPLFVLDFLFVLFSGSLWDAPIWIFFYTHSICMRVSGQIVC